MQTYDDAELLYTQLASMKPVNAPLNLDCQQLVFLHASCTLALLTISRLWFRWTGKPTILHNLAPSVDDHIHRLRLFDLIGETLQPFQPKNNVLDTYNPISDKQIIPQFIPGHHLSNDLIAGKVLDAIGDSIRHWFNDEHLYRNVWRIVSELSENVAHSQDYGYITLQHYHYKSQKDPHEVVIAISDLGQGIRGTLSTRYSTEDISDSACILMALNPGITHTSEVRGAGLNEVRRMALVGAKDAELRIRSGMGSVVLHSDGTQHTKDDLADIPGVHVNLKLRGGARQNLGRWVQ
ncbi:hypothetical protein G4Y79_18565 [Phototrophicus methaneseepsis]|uniref:Uncharacterized protein n=1 Tax=Phototrophicus methaneseepsis TaxID=2710758 RepID=A0A7S8IDT4_9CHLR|nr:hypothetical protein [Phototrophicus methaneseepsis]QPC81674.1 hypothetical protein G4Y79_18565 [Phototrophicus methaneseepsis]